MMQMDNIHEERQAMFLARPLRYKKEMSSKQPTEYNIFRAMKLSQPLPNVQKLRGKSYDFVGSQAFKYKYIEKEQQNKQNDEPEADQTTMQNQTQNIMNSTIHRSSILSKMSRNQSNIITRESRQLLRYKEYQDFWDKQSNKLHVKTLRKKDSKTLLEDNVKGLYVHQNADRKDIINTYVVNVWEMSLRNNNKILQRHIKGNTFSQTELNQMLQTEKGIKKVQQSIPVLPLQKLKSTSKKQLSLTGRNRSLSETLKSRSTSISKNTFAQIPNQEEVYKISYTGNVKWMSTEGL